MISVKQNFPRWVIFLIDLTICFFSIILAYQLRFNFSVPADESDRFMQVIPIVLGVRAVSFVITRIYAGIIRYTGSRDAVRIVATVFAGSLFIGIANIIAFNFFGTAYLVPFSIIVIDFLCSTTAMTGIRLAVKLVYMEITNPTKEKKNVVIFGAGEAGIITKRSLDRDITSKFKVVAFIDDDKKKTSKQIEGIKIYGSNELDSIFDNNIIENLIIAVPKLNPIRKSEITESALNHNVRVLDVPPVNRWINGELSFKQIKKVKIEDLLGRDEIILDEDSIRGQMKGKVILVTGAAGSIGSGLVKQILTYQPKKLVLLDIAESPLYELETELVQEFNFKNFEVGIGDIRDEGRMDRLFQLFRPEIVFHAAAYKHVPMMENNPAEAVHTNIQGTRIIADMAVKYGVERFIMISTDKAVNPSNVMGASKRIAETYTQSLGKNSKTKFITTRFGNVLDSNGSVIPLFRKQIEKGGPVTVTDPEVTRFFMTIPEACQLVLEASAMGQGGEIYIFDMGKSVKIIDLAKKMIRLSRLELGRDIQIVFTGLRPGEKLFEELLAKFENTIPTHFPKIMIAKVKEYEFQQVKENVDVLISMIPQQDNVAMVTKMKEIVPEFVSNNSLFEELDKK
ncbi:MAG: nucleoside-diphosphate sugar epimerase/dehydratase [Bacteroidota bacterium]